MSEIFLVKHRRRLRDDIFSSWFIGWYSTRALAEAAIDRSRPLPGFRDYPDCFVIWELELDAIYEENADDD